MHETLLISNVIRLWNQTLKPDIWYSDFLYQAPSWKKKRRVIGKVEWHQGELFSRVGFMVTNMSAEARGVVHFYNGQGTAEQWNKEGKFALNRTRLSADASLRIRFGLPCSFWPTTLPIFFADRLCQKLTGTGCFAACW